MSEINQYVGSQIKMYRKVQKMTLQQLADRIHKSRATVSKYENGEISIDIETLYEISQALDVNINQLTSYRPPVEEPETAALTQAGKGAFFAAERLYFYFYEGRHQRLKEGIIDIDKSSEHPGDYDATFVINAGSANGRSGAVYYNGKVVYSDMLIRFSFVNRYNTLEEDLLYIFNPLEKRDFTEGLLCGISSTDLMPCAFKCLVTLAPQELDEELMKHLVLTKEEFQRWKKLNMFIVDNQSHI